jgi:hypothetical protein
MRGVWIYLAATTRHREGSQATACRQSAPGTLTIMTPMLRAIRTTAVLLLAVTVGAGSALAPEHMHERDDHHPNVTVHRHFAPHHAGQGSDQSRLDDDDDHVIWLTPAWLQVAIYHGPNVVSTPAIWCGFAATTLQWSAIVLDDAAPPHGPPRTSRSSRAPPFPASLT